MFPSPKMAKEPDLLENCALNCTLNPLRNPILIFFEAGFGVVLILRCNASIGVEPM